MAQKRVKASNCSFNSAGPSQARKEAEQYYRKLRTAERAARRNQSWSWLHWESVLHEAAERIVDELNPQTLKDIREYDGKPDAHDDHRLAYTMIGYLIDLADDGDADLSFRLYRFPEEIGFAEVLAAPVESPADLIEWLKVKHREKFDGAPCSRCGEPLPYDERREIEYLLGRRAFHASCCNKQKEEEGWPCVPGVHAARICFK